MRTWVAVFDWVPIDALAAFDLVVLGHRHGSLHLVERTVRALQEMDVLVVAHVSCAGEEPGHRSWPEADSRNSSGAVPRPEQEPAAEPDAPPTAPPSVPMPTQPTRPPSAGRSKPALERRMATAARDAVALDLDGVYLDGVAALGADRLGALVARLRAGCPDLVLLAQDVEAAAGAAVDSTGPTETLLEASRPDPTPLASVPPHDGPRPDDDRPDSSNGGRHARRPPPRRA